MNKITSRILFFVLLFTALASAQELPAQHTVLILPFENATQQATLSWIGEAFPEVLGQRLAAQSMFVISREDRQYAFDRMGIPVNLRASRATLYKIASQLDVDYVLLGSYAYDGKTFTVRAQLLDMKALRLSSDILENGPLNSLIAVQTALAWDVSHEIYGPLPEPKQSFVQRAPVIRLDAFENFIRGVVANNEADRIRYLKAAIGIDSNYAQAILLLGRTYYNGHSYEQGAEWFGKVPKGNESSPEANFYLGLCEFHQGHFERAASAFQNTASQVPLTEVLNDIGAAEYRRGRPDALGYFQKAVEADGSDADYRFNLAIALYHHGDLAGAQRQLRECLSRRPSDTEAARLQEALTAAAATHAPVTYLPQSRIKSNYDESSYRRLVMDLQNAIEKSVDKAQPAERSKLHIERGHEFLVSGANGEAESQFREALVHEPMNPEALSGLAKALLLQGKVKEARVQATASNRIHPNPEACLVLARADVRENNLDAAREDLRKAEELSANRDEAQAVAREIQDKFEARPN
ncbi:MAG: tetratricopeptide repeat protein [Acidobacteriota bacterium]|nr:tetratricopeptide repeat protein [Acidobacteriota bacterium]